MPAAVLPSSPTVPKTEEPKELEAGNVEGVEAAPEGVLLISNTSDARG